MLLKSNRSLLRGEVSISFSGNTEKSSSAEGEGRRTNLQPSLFSIFHRLHTTYKGDFSLLAMALAESAPQLNFLRDSAQFLSFQSPSTSAHLLAVHNRILHDQFRPLNFRQHETFCGACGSLRTPHITKKVEIKEKSAKSKAQKSKVTKPAGSQDAPPGAVVYKCLRCYKRAVQPIRKPASRKNIQSVPIAATEPVVSSTAASTSKTSPQEAADAATPSVSSKTTSENASSKKRAKARKQGGLQALLASKQRSQTQTSSSLDLFDFLQQ